MAVPRWPAAVPGAGRGAPAAKKKPFTPITKQTYGKGAAATKYPAKKAGMSGDAGGKRKASALERKEK